MKQDYLFRYLFYASLILITYLAVMPAEDVSVGVGWDKANHSLAFLLLIGVFDLAYPRGNIYWKKLPLLLLYGIFLETLQSWFPDRFASLLDVVADFVGLASYCLIRPLLFSCLPWLYKNHIDGVEH